MKRTALIESLESRRLLSVALPTALPLPPTGAGASTNVTSVKGIPLTFKAEATTPFSGAVAQFSGYTGDFTKLSATINWGDGTPASIGTIAATPNGIAPALTVVGQHTFARAGTYTVEAIVTQPSTALPGGSNAILVVADIKSTAQVSVKGIPVAIAATAYKPFTGLVAQLAGFAGNASTLSVTINWGDGTAASKGSIAPTTNIANILSILGQHTYTKSGAFTVEVIVTQQTGPTGSTTPIILVADIKSTAKVAPFVNGVKLTEAAGKAFTATVGSFIYSGITPVATNASAPTLSATIDWGDNSSSAGKILLESAGAPIYDAVGSHTYAKTGVYKVHVVVTSRLILPPISTIGAKLPQPPTVIIADFFSEIDVVPPSTATI
jgi:hypothetical protein